MYKETIKLIDWKFTLIIGLYSIVLITVGKLSASYEGCKILYDPVRPYFLTILSILPFGVLYMLRSYFFKVKQC